MKNFIILFELVKSNFSNPTDSKIEEILSFLKDRDATILESVMVLRKLFGYGQSEADKIVLNSNIWKDKKNEILSFRKSIEDELHNLDDDSK